MKDEDIHVVLKLIRQIIQPWPSPFLDVSKHHDLFTVLIGCVLSLRAKDKVTEEAYDRLFTLADRPISIGEPSCLK